MTGSSMEQTMDQPIYSLVSSISEYPIFSRLYYKMVMDFSK